MHRIALALARGGRSMTDDRTGDTKPRTHVFDEAFHPTWDESILSNRNTFGVGPRWWRLA